LVSVTHRKRAGPDQNELHRHSAAQINRQSLLQPRQDGRLQFGFRVGRTDKAADGSEYQYGTGGYGDRMAFHRTPPIGCGGSMTSDGRQGKPG